MLGDPPSRLAIANDAEASTTGIGFLSRLSFHSSQGPFN